MRGLVQIVSGASLALAVALPALAQPVGTSLTLKDASKAPDHTVIDSAYWHCSAGICMASGGASQPALRACKRVVAQLGPVNAFTWQGKTLSADELATCNTAARA
ncbi:MAG TPA: hypothetical protein VG407_03900 [Caulobacteraceae bacterium]|jgi:hypothetical protein|nr:hypothetical protein [Caulobacteraceae bacterium]